MDFGNGETTMVTTTGLTDSDDAWFTLDGRKLSQKPSAKGLYINGGRKVVIK